MKTILLLEPRPKRREILCQCLSVKFDIVLADSVTDGTKLLQSRHDIGLVISGLHVDGNESVFDLLREAKTLSVPFVFCCLYPSHLTHTLQDSLMTTCKLLGADAILIQEHLDTDELMSTIEALRTKQGAD